MTVLSYMTFRRRLTHQESLALRLLPAGTQVAQLDPLVPVDETTPLQPGALERERERGREYRRRAS